ncbi:hypothetical protein RRG08_032797 [Elysia crispata]|uniref:Uncharacterized protein n=1 Tax=Elysia crispata TaxID=231223 RepID=A0AAE0YQ93_9GAST|nr:hypothetical protein RRG08_032797 [Elysia crispata]
MLNIAVSLDSSKVPDRGPGAAYSQTRKLWRVVGLVPSGALIGQTRFHALNAWFSTGYSEGSVRFSTVSLMVGLERRAPVDV